MVRPKITLEDTRLLCVTPQKDPQQLFAINLGTQEASSVHLKPHKVIDQNDNEVQLTKIYNKVKREEYKLDTLLDRHQQQKEWFFNNSTAESYRRQMIPFYLLEPECNKYPRYIDHSNINTSLTIDYKLKSVKIKLSGAIENMLSQGNISHIMKRLEKYVISLENFSLLSTADKLIKQVEKKINKDFDKALQQSNKNVLLKFKGIESYLYEDIQLIYFVEIREFLRSRDRDLELILVSVEQSYSSRPKRLAK